MKISKSKQELARIIGENGGWRDGAEWAAQDKSYCGRKNNVVLYKSKPLKPQVGESCWGGLSGEMLVEFGVGELVRNWHQTILSRAEYFHLYQVPDDDGWIEWKGEPKSPVSKGTPVDVKMQSGTQHFGQLIDDACWSDCWGEGSIIAYRLHKLEQAKSAAVGDDETNLAAKEELEAMEYKPSIEQLMQTYTYRAHSVQLANEHMATCTKQANEAMEALSVACKAAGFDISPITAKQETELVITDWRGLQVGDWVEIIESCSGERAGHVGVITNFSRTDERFRVRVCFNGNIEDYEWLSKWRFIRRP